MTWMRIIVYANEEGGREVGEGRKKERKEGRGVEEGMVEAFGTDTINGNLYCRVCFSKLLSLDAF